MDRFLQLGMVAAKEAVRDACLDITPETGRVGSAVLCGSGIGGIGTIVDAAMVLHTRGPDRVSPFVVPMMLPDMLSGPDRHPDRAPRDRTSPSRARARPLATRSARRPRSFGAAMPR